MKMMMEKSEGIIIRLTKLTETSLIVHWCTRDHGLIKTVAKGARRSKGAFAGKLDLFFEAELNWVRSRKSELHTLSEIAVMDYRENIRKRYRDTLVASYFVDLLAHVVEPDHPVPELYDLLQRGLGYLGENGADQRGILHFEHELARLLGVAHERASAAMALEQAFGSMPRSRSSCMDEMAQ
jgi:DNA repair protein RecO (recombination protein O)